MKSDELAARLVSALVSGALKDTIGDSTKTAKNSDVVERTFQLYQELNKLIVAKQPKPETTVL